MLSFSFAVLYCFRGIASLGRMLQDNSRLQAQIASLAGEPTAAQNVCTEDGRENGIMHIRGEKFIKNSKLRS